MSILKKTVMTAAVLLMFACLPVLFISGSGIEKQPDAQTSDLGTSAASGAPVVLKTEIYDGIIVEYELVADNGTLQMYADLRYGYFFWQDKASGKRWFSIPRNVEDSKQKAKSQVIVHYIDSTIESNSPYADTVNSFAACIRDENRVTVKRIKNGISVTYPFVDEGFELTCEYAIEGDKLVAAVLNGSIKETGTLKITAVDLLPYCASAGAQDKGYMFVPDGSGALIPLDSSKDEMIYTAPVYGTDKSANVQTQQFRSEPVRLPVFGIRANEEALLGIITAGETQAEIVAGIHGETNSDTAVSARYIYRTIQSTILFENDWANRQTVYSTQPALSAIDRFEVTYSMLPEGETDYVGMAKRFRQYLIDEKGLSKKTLQSAFTLSVVGSVKIDSSFLGIPYQKLLPLTTYAQAQQIASELQGSGIDSLQIRYTGWQNTGLQNDKIPVKASPLGKLGGKRQLESLMAYAKENGISLFLETDPISFVKGGNSVRKASDAIKDSFGIIAEQHQYKRSVYIVDDSVPVVCLLTPRKAVDLAQKYAASFSRLNGSAGVSLSGVGSVLYSDFGKKAMTTRDQTQQAFEEILDGFADTPVAVSGGNMFAAVRADTVYDCPVYSGGHQLFETGVPFYQIVFHGYTRMVTDTMQQAFDRDTLFLKAVESGCDIAYTAVYEEPSELTYSIYNSLYSTGYTYWKDEAAAYYSRYRAVASANASAVIVGHRMLSEQVSETVYDTGCRVIVNYNDHEVTIDGVTIGAMDFYAEGKNGEKIA